MASMPRSRSYIRFQRPARLLVVVASIFVHFGTVCGFPMPHHTPVKSSAPFPCQHHRCGCVSPEQCWRDCCCMSMQEKLAWARDNNVTPPDYALKKSRQRLAAGCQCCCSQSSCKPSDSHRKSCEAEAGEQVEVEWIVGVHAQKCHGLSTEWVAAGAILPPPPTVTPPSFEPGLVELLTARPLLWRSISRAPDVPPPRCIPPDGLR